MKSPVIRFTESEARTVVGRRVETLVEFAGVPIGTNGTVVDTEPIGKDEYNVVIKWDVPEQNYTQKSRFAKSGYMETLREKKRKALAAA